MSNKTKPKPKAAPKKRKAPVIAADEGPRRRSGRIAGLEADGDALKAKVEEEEKEREILRVVNRKEREKVMDVGKMVEDTPEDEIKDMVSTLQGYITRYNSSTVNRKRISNLLPSCRILEPTHRKRCPLKKLMPTLIPCPRKYKDSKTLLKI